MKLFSARHILPIAAVLGGCATDLRTGEIVKTGKPEALQAGFVYNLPAAAITPSGTLRVAGCPLDEDAKKALEAVPGQKFALPVKSAMFAVSADIGVEQVAGKQVLIDYRELGEFLKTSSIGMERHPNLMLKSINVAVEDESPAVIANLAIVAANIALFATAPPVAGAAGGIIAAAMANEGAKLQKVQKAGMLATDQVEYLACKPETIKLLEKRTAARDAKAQATLDLERSNAALTRLLRHADTGFTPAELASIHGYRDNILDLTATIADATDTIAKTDAELGLKLDIADGVRTPAVIMQDGIPIEDIVGGKITLTSDVARIQEFITRHFLTATAQVPAGIGSAFRARECTSEPVPTCMSAALLPAVVGKLATAKLGRGLIMAKPQPDAGELCHGEEG